MNHVSVHLTLILIVKIVNNILWIKHLWTVLLLVVISLEST